MIKIHVNLTEATGRIVEVLDAINRSAEWEVLSRELPHLGFMDARKALRRFFDAYEGRPGEEWLGILEWATVEEARLKGARLSADDQTLNAIVVRLKSHPNIKMSS